MTGPPSSTSARRDDPEPGEPTIGRVRERSVALSLLVAVWLAFIYPVLGGRTPFPVALDTSGGPAPGVVESSNPYDSDAYDQYYVWRSHLGKRLRSGELPLWDPHRFAGTPFAANPQAAVFFPPNWLYALGPPLVVFTAHYVLGILGALLLCYWFLRTIRLRPTAAALGASVFVFSGFLMAWRNHPTFLSSAMWLPLALGSLERTREGPIRLWTPLAGVALGLSILGGHSQVGLFVWLITGLWVMVGASSELIAKGPSSALRLTGRSGAAFTLGLGLSFIQTWPSLEFSGHIGRPAISGAQAIETMSLPISHLATLFTPDRFGNPLDGTYAGVINYTETAVYAGLVAVILALLGVYARRDRVTAGFVAIGVTGALCAWGTPLYLVLHDLVPGLSQIARPNRFVFLVDVGAAGLVAVGADALLARRRDLLRPAMAATALVAGAFLICVLVPTTAPSLPASVVTRGILILLAAAGACWIASRTVAHPAVAGALLLALLAADLWLFGFRYHPFSPARPVYAQTDRIAELTETPFERSRMLQADSWSLPPNAALEYGVFDVGGYDTFLPKTTEDLLRPWQVAPLPNTVGAFTLNEDASDVLDLMGVRSVVTPVAPGDPATGIVRRPDHFPAAILVHCWVAADPGSTADRVLAMTSSELRTYAVVSEADVRRGAVPDPETDCVPGAATSLEGYEPEEVHLRVRSDRDGILVLTDTWYPGWHARVDGLRSEVLRVDHGFRGVVVPAGATSVEFYFRPSSLALGSAVTLLTIVTGLLWAAGPRVRRLLRPDRRTEPGRTSA